MTKKPKAVNDGGFMPKLGEAHKPRYLTVTEAAERAGLCEGCLNRLRSLGGGPAFEDLGKFGILYEIMALDIWMRNQSERTFDRYDCL